MSDHGFKVGDVVQLKGGGPIMTVTEVGQSSGGGKMKVWTVWFDAAKEVTGAFPVESVKHYKTA